MERQLGEGRDRHESRATEMSSHAIPGRRASSRSPRMKVGTAAWSVPRVAAELFPAQGSHLQRYAQVLDCTEVNTSFYRSHKRETYEKWAGQTPSNFRFAVKLPRQITHEGALRAARKPLQQFLGECSGLGRRLAVLLVQLPPSLPFETRIAARFFALLAELHGGAVVCEPRHASWFEPRAERLLIAAHVGRVGADPAPHAGASIPGGWLGDDGNGAGAVVYHRWHGSPRTYWSSYDETWLAARAVESRRWSPTADCWFIFDNTASGAAAANAVRFRAMTGSRRR